LSGKKEASQVKSFKTHLTELFDQPFPLYSKKEDHSEARYVYKWMGDDGKEQFIVVYFARLSMPTTDSWDCVFTRNRAIAVTGEGKASQVFASVLDAFKKFLQKYEPHDVSFLADKNESGSRTKLYADLIRRYAEASGYKLEGSKTVGKTDRTNKGRELFSIVKK
jgi:hypothetical protein